MRILHYYPCYPPDAAYWEFPFPSPGAIRAFLSTALLGDMGYDPEAPNARRDAFACSLGVDVRGVIAARQVHGKRVVMAGEATLDRGIEADGIASSGDALALSVTVADCMPIWLHSLDSGGAYALLHSGSKGTGIALEGLRALEGLGADPGRVEAILGPCIGPCCYDVDEARAEAFAAEFGMDAAPARGGKRFLDLRAANVALLMKAGLRAITIVEACTSCAAALGSFRREGAARFTRMMALAVHR